MLVGGSAAGWRQQPARTSELTVSGVRKAPGVLAVSAMGTKTETKWVGIWAPICVVGSWKNVLVQPRGEMLGEPENWFG